MKSNAENEEDKIPDIFSDISEMDNDPLFKALTEFFEDLSTKTDIPKNRIQLIIRLIFYANLIKQFDAETGNMLMESITDYYKLRISKDRIGRKEAFTTMQKIISQEEKKENILSRIFK